MRTKIGVAATVLGALALAAATAYLAYEFARPTQLSLAEAAGAGPALHVHDHDEHGEEEHGEEASHAEHEHSAPAAPGHDGETGEHGEHFPEVHLPETERQALGLVLREAAPGKLTVEVELPAEVRLNEDHVAHIVPRVSGIVREVHKHIGDRVLKGELMAVLDSRELADSQAEYLAANSRLELARKEFTREKSLWEAQISAERDYLAASRELQEAQIAVRAAGQKLQALGLSEAQLRDMASGRRDFLTRYEMTSPFDGEVLEKHIVLGEALESQANAFIIADLDTVWVDVQVFEKDLPHIRPGMTVQISGPEGHSATEGVITYVAPVVDRETRTTLARIVLPNTDRRWRPGLFLRVQLRLEQAEAAVLIPKTAVQRFESAPVVFVEDGDELRAVEVELGHENSDSVEIVSGLPAGTRYVAEGAFELKARIVTSNLGAHAGHGH
ncbi:MAG TPA: efflux RND transporter periplasmic adaptor subunit [Candidatus Hydrogenedentes bacterium]|jgi:cobalt-zinc-cadmium efflux system membrane fusion protein|nr:efflux RND transporter periplasmic adaptor subunit [Candidatus Hydrogenedentota bacterium]HPJ98242.1 efflux RND transporter periplasmic adaptor subunit [Candidatus Hydrogenedentota bacterium]